MISPVISILGEGSNSVFVFLRGQVELRDRECLSGEKGCDGSIQAGSRQRGCYSLPLCPSDLGYVRVDDRTWMGSVHITEDLARLSLLRHTLSLSLSFNLSFFSSSAAKWSSTISPSLMKGENGEKSFP